VLQVGAWPQLSVPGATPSAAAAKPDVPKDPLGRSTPRGTVIGFLSASVKREDNIAAGYLNTRLRGKAAAVLAHQLFVVLDRRLPAELNQLSDKPEGSGADLQKATQELVGTISSVNGNVDILLDRVEDRGSGSIWLFSSKTLEAIPNLYEEVSQIEIERLIPEVFVDTRLANIPLFELLAVFLGMPLFYLLTGMLNRLISSIVGWLRRRLYRKTELPNPECLPKPVRLLLLALTIYWVKSKVGLPLLARQFWSNTAAMITITALVWLCILLNSGAERYIHRYLGRQSVAVPTSMLRLGRRTVDIVIIFVGIAVFLHSWGMSPSAALAGLGVGGIAVALAAQKTLENVIGGVSLILDRALHSGPTHGGHSQGRRYLWHS
jgi:MscS family membrane protein